MEAHTEELIITAARSALRALPTASRRRLLDEEADFIGFELVASNSPVPSPSPTPSELHSPVPFPSPTPSELEAEHPPGSAGSLSTAPPMDHGRGSGAPPIVCAMPLSSIAPLPMAPAYPLAATAFDSRSSLQFAAPNASIDAPEELLKLKKHAPSLFVPQTRLQVPRAVARAPLGMVIMGSTGGGVGLQATRR